MFSHVIELIKTVKTVDDYGDHKSEEVRRPIFARLDRVYLKEAIEGQAQGLKPEQRFTIADYLDYENEKELAHEGVRYQILNVMRKGIELEIVCYGGVEDGTT